MTHRTLLFATILVALTAKAQDKGFVSGTMSFVSQHVEEDGSSDDVTNTTGTFGPAVGINLTPVHVVGLALNVTGNRSEYKVSGLGGAITATDKTNLVEIAPFYRYMKSVGDKFLIYGQAKVGFGFGKTTHEINASEEETKISTVRAGIGPGIVYVPATRWALSADWGLLGYKSVTSKIELENSDMKSTTSGFEATLNPGAITLALNWLF